MKKFFMFLVLPLLLGSCTKEVIPPIDEELPPPAERYAVRYDLKDGINDSHNPMSYSSVDGEVILYSPTKTGYTFNGWLCDGESIYSLTPENVTSTVYLEATWSLTNFNINYFLDGGINDSRNPGTYTINDEVVFYEPTKAGYEFVGWFLDNRTQVAGINRGSSSNKSVYARWNKLPAKIFAVNVILGTGIETPLYGMQYIEEGSYFTLEFHMTMNPGYQFLAWYVDGEFVSDKLNYYFYPTRDCTLEAKTNYREIPIVYLNHNGMVEDTYPTSYTLETGVGKLPTPICPYTDGVYDFACWIDENTRNTFDPECITCWTLTLTAYYVPASRNLEIVNLDPSAGDSFEYNGSEAMNRLVSLYATPNKGYKFSGWYDENDNLVSNNPNFSFKMPITKYYLAAKWEKIKYLINYNLNGGTNHPDNPSFYTIDSNIELKSPVKEGYTFSYWIDQHYNTVSNISGSRAEDIILEAVWAANYVDYSINVNDNALGNIKMDCDSPYYGTTFRLTATFHAPNTKFDGFFDSVTGEKLCDSRFYEGTFGAEELRVTAMFSKIENNENSGTDSYSYYLGDKEAAIFCQNSNESEFVCPGSVTFENEIFTVTEIGYDACKNSPNIIKITFSDSIKYFAQYAFLYSNIESVEFPESLSFIDSFAFLGSKLRSVTIPKAVEFIGDYCFKDCYLLKSINVDSENEYYDSRYNCNAIIDSTTKIIMAGCSSTIIPSDIYGIHSYANYDDRELRIPGNIKYIGSWAFNNHCNFETLIFESGIRSFESFSVYSFLSVHTLKEIYLPDSLRYVFNNIFQYCENIEKIEVDDQNSYFKTGLDYNALISNNGSLIIGCKNSLISGYCTSIENNAFNSVTMESLYLDGSIDEMRDGAFQNCDIDLLELSNDADCVNEGVFEQTRFQNIYVQSYNCKYYDSVSNALILRENNKVILGCANTVLPDFVEIIGEYVFCNIHFKNGFYFPTSLKKIESNAFDNCIINELIFNEGLLEIEHFAIYIDTRIVILPSTLKKVDNYSLVNSSNSSYVFVPSTVEYMDFEAIKFDRSYIYTDASDHGSWDENWCADHENTVYYNTSYEEFLSIVGKN